jgi:hypothetical protein
MSLTHRAPLLLRSDSDMVPIAHALLGIDRPFIVCDPHQQEAKESVRSPANYETGMAAAWAAIGGSLCARARRLPRDFPAVLARVREPNARMQLIVCLERQVIALFLAEPIEVPALAMRAQDLPRIIDEYARDAIAILGAPATSFRPDDHCWVLEHAAQSLPEIEKATLRRVALRTSTNVNRAAARLGDGGRVAVSVARPPAPGSVADSSVAPRRQGASSIVTIRETRVRRYYHRRG